jgi:hypothetical protein
VQAGQWGTAGTSGFITLNQSKLSNVTANPVICGGGEIRSRLGNRVSFA